MFIVKYKKYWIFPSKPIIINTKKKEYDSEPVIACANCHSLGIIKEDNMPEYCKDCGSTVHLELTIDELLELKSSVKVWKQD